MHPPTVRRSCSGHASTIWWTACSAVIVKHASSDGHNSRMMPYYPRPPQAHLLGSTICCLHLIKKDIVFRSIICWQFIDCVRPHVRNSTVTAKRCAHVTCVRRTTRRHGRVIDIALKANNTVCNACRQGEAGKRFTRIGYRGLPIASGPSHTPSDG
jgi:hypothetical protein